MSLKKRVLVSGAKGQLALTIRDLSLNNLSLDWVFLDSSQLDITNSVEISKALKKHNVDYFINCAAYTNVEQAEKTPEYAFKVNAEALEFLSLECKAFDIILIHISTDYVFDGEKKEPYTVFDETNPINQYGKSKLLGEQLIQRILDKYYIVRTSWLYSKKHGNNFYRTILEKTKQSSELSVIDTQIGCPTDTVNLANYLIRLILEEDQEFGVLHYCDEKPMSWYDFAKFILIENKLLEQIRLVKADNYTTFAKRPKYSVLSTTKKNRVG